MAMLFIPALLLPVLLAGCDSDFGLQTLPDPALGGDDTALPGLTDAPAAEDTGSVSADTSEPAVEEEGDPTVEEEAPPEDDCTETSDLIYVIDRGTETLSLFDPSLRRFTPLGQLSCPSGSATPGSMAVSRSGTAYVRYSDNTVYSVSLSDLSCVRTDYRASSSFGSFGMGYATDSASTWRDQLYVASAAQVARLDTTSWSLEVLGRMASQSELTGTSAGELWAFLPLESPPLIVELDRETSTELQRIRITNFPNLSDIDTFAFAAWGGEFWLFIRTYGMGSSTDVYRVGTDGRLSTVLEDVGFDVVGAGVSTCAPSE
jgi:hypothetical protein